MTPSSFWIEPRRQLKTNQNSDPLLRGAKKDQRAISATGLLLTSTEANGLIAAWRKQFLETPGERLLVRLNKNHYDYACPLKIRPIPTECARVGLVLHELSFADE